MIVLTDIVARIVNRVGGRLCGVVDNRHRGDLGRAQADARRIAQVDVESFVSFDERVVVDEHDEILRGFAGCEAQAANGSDVITTLAGRDVCREVVDARRAGSIADTIDGNR